MDEHELQQRLHRAVEGATPDSARLWENVMDASEHARKTRNAKRTGIALAVLAFAIATPIAVMLAGSDSGEIAGPGPSESPSASPTGEPVPVGGVAYIDTELNLTFPIPDGWKVTEFEGHRTAAPEGVPAPPEDGDTVYFSAAYDDLAPAGKEGREATTFASLDAERVETARATWIYVPEWPASPLCPTCSDGPITLWWEASTSEMRAQYEDAATSILDGARPLYTDDGLAAIAAASAKTRRGTIGEDVAINDAVLTVAAFNDTRAWVADYGMFITDDAMQQYIDLEMPDGSSRRDFPEQWFLETYEIVSSDAADANSFEIVVEVTFVKYDGDNEETFVATERLFVGPGPDTSGTRRDFVVRGVVDES